MKSKAQCVICGLSWKSKGIYKMIFLDRTKFEKPAVLEEVYQRGKWKGKTERQKAIEYFDQKGTIKGFKFEKYSDRTVKDALAALSHHKCSYCESDIGATQPVEVEHFRPKGIVLVQNENGELEERYGYYWLGSDWNNLLPSCIDCNRERYHESEDEELVLAGKKNLFPIADENQRATEPDNEGKEDKHRLLLDPTRDEPEKYLEFFEDGVVKASQLSDGIESAKGKTTIEVYALWRPGLSRRRKGTYLKILASIDDVNKDREDLKDIMTLLEKDPENETLIEMKKRALEGLAGHLAELHQYQITEKEYAGMARQIIKKRLPSLED